MRSRGTRLAKEDSMTIDGAILLQIVMVTNFSVTDCHLKCEACSRLGFHII